MNSRLWLTHHSDSQLDRCSRVGSHLVCRRCLSSYPIAIATMMLGLAGFHWPNAWDATLLWLLPLPAIAEFIAEHVASLRYNPRRQMVLSGVAGLAFGRGLTRYLQANQDRLFWTVAIVYSVVMVLSVLWKLRAEHVSARNRAQRESDAWWSGVEKSLDTQKTKA